MSRECKSHVTLLRKVATRLAFNVTMNYKPIILSAKGMKRVRKAESKIYEAIKLLDFDSMDVIK